jgi:hypothetical protein
MKESTHRKIAGRTLVAALTLGGLAAGALGNAFGQAAPAPNASGILASSAGPIRLADGQCHMEQPIGGRGGFGDMRPDRLMPGPAPEDGVHIPLNLPCPEPYNGPSPPTECHFEFTFVPQLPNNPITIGRPGPPRPGTGDIPSHVPCSNLLRGLGR